MPNIKFSICRRKAGFLTPAQWSRIWSCQVTKSTYGFSVGSGMSQGERVVRATPPTVQVEGSTTWYHLNHCTKLPTPSGDGTNPTDNVAEGVKNLPAATSGLSVVADGSSPHSGDPTIDPSAPERSPETWIRYDVTKLHINQTPCMRSKNKGKRAREIENPKIE